MWLTSSPLVSSVIYVFSTRFECSCFLVVDGRFACKVYSMCNGLRYWFEFFNRFELWTLIFFNFEPYKFILTIFLFSICSGELEKLGRPYRLALAIARDPRFTKLTCTHKGDKIHSKRARTFKTTLETSVDLLQDLMPMTVSVIVCRITVVTWSRPTIKTWNEDWEKYRGFRLYTCKKVCFSFLEKLFGLSTYIKKLIILFFEIS